MKDTDYVEWINKHTKTKIKSLDEFNENLFFELSSSLLGKDLSLKTAKNDFTKIENIDVTLKQLIAHYESKKISVSAQGNLKFF